MGLQAGVTPPKGSMGGKAVEGWHIKGLLAALGLSLPQMSEKGELVPLRS